MKCIQCSSEKLKHPDKQSSMELVKCLSCGHEFYVHCFYPIPDVFQSKHKIYLGYFSVSSPKDTVASFIKLKSILKGCEWFQLSKLEAQKLEGKTKWELGQFLDIEVEKIRPLCKQKNIEIEFNEIKE
ncbi:hypothetical protein [Litoribacillus peritrichatus]|uniref:Uncharacterized protein n=1 Tax=Litoribacillus peritrichatus TaxID=718191 RepID=A0ABP7MAT9_9GAMM